MNTVIRNQENEELFVRFTDTNIKIYDSYLVPKKKIKAWTKQLKEEAISYGFHYTREPSSWAAEWCAHNLLYELKIKEKRTKDVDLNEDESRIKKIIYSILAIFYR